MVRRAYTQRSLVEVLLPDGDKLWDPTLRRIDTILDDDALVDHIADALARRHPQSRGRGRLGTPAAVVLRMLVLKHLYDWSFDECEREVRGHLVYRAFCRIDGERVPDAKTLIRLAHLPSGATDREAQAVGLAAQAGVDRIPARQCGVSAAAARRPTNPAAARSARRLPRWRRRPACTTRIRTSYT